MEVSFKCSEKRRSSLIDCVGFALSKNEEINFPKQSRIFALKKGITVCFLNNTDLSICVRPYFRYTEAESPFKIYEDLKVSHVNKKELNSQVTILPNQTFKCDITIVPGRKFLNANRAENEFCIEANILGQKPRVVFSEKVLEVSHKWISNKKNNNRVCEIEVECDSEEDDPKCIQVLNPYYKTTSQMAPKLEISLNEESVELPNKEIKELEETAIEALTDLSEVFNPKNPNSSFSDIEKKSFDESADINLEMPMSSEQINERLKTFEGTNQAKKNLDDYEVPTSLIIGCSPDFSKPIQSPFNRKPSQHTHFPYPRDRTLDSSEKNNVLNVNSKKCKIKLQKREKIILTSLEKKYDYLLKEMSNGTIDLKYGEETLNELKRNIEEVYINARERAEAQSIKRLENLRS